MSKSIDVSLSQLRLPRSCVVCLSPAAAEYELQRVLSYGRRSYTVKIGLPMCNHHREAARRKGTAERLVEILALILGIGAGLAALVILLLRWEQDSGDSLLLKLLAGGVFGFGVFIMVWAAIAMGLAPLCADSDSQEARTAVKITQFWPNEQVVRLEFRQEVLAETLQRQN